MKVSENETFYLRTKSISCLQGTDLPRFHSKVMKKDFVIFYSWMSDRPHPQNNGYIKKVLKKECKELGNNLGITISIDSDSRGEDGSNSIDENVLKKISACDLFVADITPIYPKCSFLWWKKPTPNPNVMYELGFAVSSLGWNRCILVWNSKYGKLSNAPFDIRNHVTASYCKGKRELSISSILKSKIEHYDEYVKEWRSGKERSFDAEKYSTICHICPERTLVDSIDKFLTNRVYNNLEFKWWDDLNCYYRQYPDNRFVDEELHQAYMNFLVELEKMTLFAAKYNKQIRRCNRLDVEIGSDEWREEEIYKIEDPYEYLDAANAAKIQDKIYKEYCSFNQTVLKSYNIFRDLIRKKLLI